MQTSTLFDAKDFGVFSKFMVCSLGQRGRGIEPVQNFAEKGEGFHFFAI